MSTTNEFEDARELGPESAADPIDWDAWSRGFDENELAFVAQHHMTPKRRARRARTTATPPKPPPKATTGEAPRKR